MSFFHLPDLTPQEREQAKRFWETRYHLQAENPVRMSPTGQKEGGYGLWDARTHARKVMNQALTDPVLFQELMMHNDTPESSMHPVSQAYQQRREFLRDQRDGACGADRDRLDLQMQAEGKGYRAWVMEETLGARRQEPEARRLLEKARQEHETAFQDLFQYDRQHGHPLTDPNRDLVKEPPSVAERRQWMLEREAKPLGYPREARRIAHDNEPEQAGLGMMARAWLTEEQDREMDREAPAHSGKLLPRHLEKAVEQRQDVDRMTGTTRNRYGSALGTDWTQALKPKTASEKSQARASFNQQQVAAAKRDNHQASEHVAHTRASQDPQSVAINPKALTEKLKARREQAAAPVEATRRSSQGQSLYEARQQHLASQQQRATPAERPRLDTQIEGPSLQEARATHRAQQQRKDQVPPPRQERQPNNRGEQEARAPERASGASRGEGNKSGRQRAEQLAKRFEERSARTGRVEDAKLANPDRMERRLALRDHTPKLTPQAKKTARKPLPEQPGSQKWLKGVQERASEFRQSFGMKWDRAMERLPWTEQAQDRAAQNRIEARARKVAKDQARPPKAPSASRAQGSVRRDEFVVRKGPMPNPQAVKPREAARTQDQASQSPAPKAQRPDLPKPTMTPTQTRSSTRVQGPPRNPAQAPERMVTPEMARDQAALHSRMSQRVQAANRPMPNPHASMSNPANVQRTQVRETEFKAEAPRQVSPTTARSPAPTRAPEVPRPGVSNQPTRPAKMERPMANPQASQARPPAPKPAFGAKLQAQEKPEVTQAPPVVTKPTPAVPQQDLNAARKTRMERPMPNPAAHPQSMKPVVPSPRDVTRGMGFSR